MKPISSRLLGFALTVGALTVHADLDPQDLAKAVKVFQDISELTAQINAYAPETAVTAPEPRHDAEGKYISPYLADGTLADWARKGIGGAAGAVVGNLVGTELGDRAADQVSNRVPGGGLLGGLVRGATRKRVAETAAVMAVGGWDYIQETSDLSFDSASDLAVYLHLNHAGTDPDFVKALGAAMGVYPRLVGAYEPAVERAYGYDVVDNVRAAAEAGRPPVAPQDEAGGETGAMLADANEGDADFLSSSDSAGSVPDVRAGGFDPATVAEVQPIELDVRRNFNTRVRPLTRSNRVVVAGFRVGFIVRDSVTASVAAGYQFGGTHTSGARSKTEVELSGVGAEVLQQLTESLYQDFLADLAVSGREIVSLEDLKATEGWSRMDFTPTSAEAPYTKEYKIVSDRLITVFSPGELPLWWEHGNRIGDKGAFALNNWKMMTAVSVDLDAVVLVPSFLLNFAELNSSGNKRGLFSGYGSGRASTGAKANMGLMGTYTAMSALHARNKTAGDLVSIPLKDDVFVGDYGAQIVTLDERDNNNASRAGLMGLAQAAGSQALFAAAGPSRSDQVLAVHSSPEDFYAYAMAAMRGVIDSYIAVMEQNAPQ